VLSFDHHFADRIPLTHGLSKTLCVLHEYRGKEALFRQQTPQVLETMRQSAIIQSVESSNRIEGVVAKRGRVKDIVEKKSPPRDRPEEEIAGYRDVLDTIHGGHQGIRLSNGIVRQFHKMLFAKTSEPGGAWKVDPNRIERKLPDGRREIRFEPPPPHLTDGLMTDLHDGLKQALRDRDFDPLLLIPAYVLDFLCIHPFRDGNGRMARLLALLLLHQQGYGVGRFISLEKIIEGSKESYYETLHASSQGWDEGEHDLTPWTEYFLGTIVDAYRQFEDRVEKAAKARGSKTQLINAGIDAAIGDFTAQEILARCPTASIDLVRQILKQRKALGEVESLGRGRWAKWRRIR
jgi:Fic family protein